jgi:hypothetical protein
VSSFYLGGVAVLAVGCISSPAATRAAIPFPVDRIRSPVYTHAEEGTALVVVTRDKGLAVLACTARLHVDGTLVADMRPREQIRLFLEEGQHLIGVSAADCIGGADQISVDVSRAKPVLLRIAAVNGYDLTIELSAF